MRRSIGRRALFFAVATLVCVALAPATPPELRWVDWATAGIGAFWAILLAFEDLLRPHPPARIRARKPEPSNPFGPPPFPGSEGP